MIYTFRNLKTGRIEEHDLKVSEYDSFKEKHKKTLERYLDEAPSFSYSGPGDFDGKKTDNAWKENMARLAELNPRTPLAEKYGRKTIKQVKTDEIIKKHSKIAMEKAKEKAARK